MRDENKYCLETDSDEKNYVLKCGESSIKYAKSENTVEGVVEKLKQIGINEIEIVGGKYEL